MTFAELQEALHVFGLGDRATLKEIRTRHRELVKRYHPDAGGGDCDERIRRINAAYKVIMEYVTSYRFSFAEDEFYEQNPEERLRRQFMDDPLWGHE
ncbi:MAG TPA: J domain-containing protein [Geobacteraceae bacterium]|nr:J domain-containing protein [Geobacteraceae bacterium]